MTPRPLVAAVALSGAAALIYQVLWVRQLGDVLGHGTLAVLVVLSVFSSASELPDGDTGRPG